MSLVIYQKADPATAFSVNGKFTNPLALTFDGSDGGISIQKFYLRNDGLDNPIAIYSAISIALVDNVNGALINGTDGYIWKLYEDPINPNTQPLQGQWDTIAPANTIAMPDISDSTTYLPFWLYVQVAPNTAVQSFQGVSLSINATATI